MASSWAQLAKLSEKVEGKKKRLESLQEALPVAQAAAIERQKEAERANNEVCQLVSEQASLTNEVAAGIQEIEVSAVAAPGTRRMNGS